MPAPPHASRRPHHLFRGSFERGAGLGALAILLLALGVALAPAAPAEARSAASCVSHCDCPRGELCDGGTGTCQAAICTREFLPVCGLDGQTYPNACEAEAAHVVVAHEGECKTDDEPGDDDSDGGGDGATCGGIRGETCAEGQVCDLPPGQCQGADLQGLCVQQPEVCPEVYQPVCGCDGETYANDCDRLRAGVQKAHEGDCAAGPPGPGDDMPPPAPGPPLEPPTGCESNDDCPAGDYCQHPGFSCQGRGACQERPDVCPQIYAPVCGCDGRTYSNACSAASHGVSVAAEGECS